MAIACWDPSAVLATGPYTEVGGYLANQWEGSLRVSPGLALIDERAGSGLQRGTALIPAGSPWPG